MPQHMFWRMTANGAEPCTAEQWERDHNPSRRIGHEDVSGITISTIFSGYNTQTDPEGPPLLYHTQIFGKAPHREEGYATREEAEAGHRRWVAHYKGDDSELDDDVGNKL